MNLFLMAGIVLAAAAASVGVTLLVRRGIRDEGAAQELDSRVPTVFAFVGTAFAVLLAFVVLEAFENYDDAREAADNEALTVVQISRTADGFAPAQRDAFEGLLLCYARAVVHHDWPAMKDGRQASSEADLWSLRMRQAMLHINTDTDLRYISFFQLMEEQDNRTQARETREAQAARNVPLPMWFVLILGALLTVAGTIAYVSRRRGSAWVQGGLVAAVAALATASLLLVVFLDRPYEGTAGSIKPVQMKRAIATMEEQQHVAAPCTATGEQRT